MRMFEGSADGWKCVHEGREGESGISGWLGRGGYGWRLRDVVCVMYGKCAMEEDEWVTVSAVGEGQCQS